MKRTPTVGIALDHGFLDSLRLHGQVFRNVRIYEETKAALLRQGQAGDIEALRLLKERFRLRLPAVEERLRCPPWVAK